MTDLLPWSGAETPCPKCQGIKVSAEYQPARGPVGYAGGDPVPEHMARCCDRCRYRWRETPAP